MTRTFVEITAFTKKDQENLTDDEKKVLRKLVKSMKAHMTQHVFADYLGVSVKTVEAWERGRTHPTGPAYRLMSFLALDMAQSLPFISVE